jgi:hypothetical protein
MKEKPMFLKLFPLLAFGIAISFPIQIYYIYAIPLSETTKVISMLTPLNLITMASLITIACLTLKLSKLVYICIPILITLVFANNAIVGVYGKDFTIIQVALSFILLGLSLSPFYNKGIRSVIENPDLRWWKTPKRHELKKPLTLTSGMFEINTITSNISKTGVFAKVSDQIQLDQIQLDQIIDLKILGKDGFEIRAKVVRKSQGAEAYGGPSGFGLEFIKDQKHRNTYLPWFKSNIQ